MSTFLQKLFILCNFFSILTFGQVQYSYWNIEYAYEKLGKNRTNSGFNGYSKIAQQIQKCVKACAKHIWKISIDSQGRSKVQKIWIYMVTILTVVTCLR